MGKNGLPMYYFASDIFSEEKKAYLEKAADILRKKGAWVYLPHQFKIDGGEHLPNYIWSKLVYEADMKALKQSDAVIYFCEGMTGDIGAAWECGYACGAGIPVKAVILDDGEDLSLMIGQSVKTFLSADDLSEITTENIYQS